MPKKTITKGDWHSGACFSPCEKYRYLLWRKWQEPDVGQYVAFIGLNPSTATHEVDDATVRRWAGFAKGWGYAGFYVLNLFAYRATLPKEMKKVIDPVGPENDAFMKHYRIQMRKIVACWGTHGTHDGRDRKVFKLLDKNVDCFGLTKDGHPKHPLYLPADTKLQPYLMSQS